MQSVCDRVDSGKLKQWILDETGYEGVGDFRKKSRLIPVDINVKVKETGKKKPKKDSDRPETDRILQSEICGPFQIQAG